MKNNSIQIDKSNKEFSQIKIDDEQLENNNSIKNENNLNTILEDKVYLNLFTKERKKYASILKSLLLMKN